MAGIIFTANAAVEEIAKTPGGLLGLTPDMAAAIHAYTQESRGGDAGGFYKDLNYLLRNERGARLQPCLPYLKLFISAIRRLKKEKCTLYVGNPHFNDEFVPSNGIYIF